MIMIVVIIATRFAMRGRSLTGAPGSGESEQASGNLHLLQEEFTRLAKI